MKRKPDRDLLIKLVEALQVSRNNLRRDPCGDWNIVGRRGHISTDALALYVYTAPGTERRWRKAKHVLNFMTVTVDGDDEGILKMSGMPTPLQAGTLRKFLGLRKAIPFTEERREALRLVGRGSVFTGAKTPVSDGLIDPGQVPATTPAAALDGAIPARIDVPHHPDDTVIPGAAI